MRRRSFLNQQHANEQASLQITSMADIFVIILVFLLKSYSVEGLPYEPTLPLTPPVARGRIDKEEGLKLEVSQKALALGGVRIMEMKGFRFPAQDVDGAGESRGLQQALANARLKKGVQTAKLVVVADGGAPYETIKTVLSSAARSGYVDIQLAVTHAN